MSGFFWSIIASNIPSGAKSLSTSSRASPLVSGKNRYCGNNVSYMLGRSCLQHYAELTMIGTQVALRTAKMMYVLQPMLRIAGGVMYTMMKLQIQFAAVLMELPFWRALRGNISEGYTYSAKVSRQRCVSDITSSCNVPRQWPGSRL